MLDTNTASYALKGHPGVRARLQDTPMSALTVSAVTQAELLFGVAKRGRPPGLAERVAAFLLRVQVLPWTSDVAVVYGKLRAACQTRGVALAPLDMMIAAHAVSAGATLVTSDRAFSHVEELVLEDWAA